jgi:hypothetical protein
MEPVSLALLFLLKNPSIAANAIEKATTPAVVDVSKMQGSFADMSRGVLADTATVPYNKRRELEDWTGA